MSHSDNSTLDAAFAIPCLRIKEPWDASGADLNGLNSLNGKVASIDIEEVRAVT